MPASTDTRTDKHKLLDQRMASATEGQTLGRYIAAERAAGTSWRLIAKAVSDITGEDVSPPTLFAWFPEPQIDGAAQ